jgi:site-specific DNA recombinase
MMNGNTSASPQLVRCAFYGRYSTKMQRLATLEDQERACREFAASKGWQVLNEHIYTDKALSGTSKVKRIQFLALEAAAEHTPRLFDYVLVDDTSRVSRDQADILMFVKLMRHFHINVYFVSQKLDSADPSFDMLLNFYSMMDAQFITRLKAKVWQAQKGRVLAGFIAGSWPYGYRPVIVENTDDPDAVGRATTKGTKLRIEANEAKVIRRIFRMFADGHSMWSICIALNLDKIPSPRSLQLGKSDAAWSRDAIKRILHNRKYLGVFVWNATQQTEHPRTGQIRKEYKLAHELVVVPAPDLRIVSDEMWARVEARLKVLEQDDQKQARLLGSFNRAKNKPYLYSGLLFCGMCGARMRIGGKDQNAVYECPNHRLRRKGCKNHLRIRQDRAAAQITEFLARQLAQPEYLEYLVTAVHDELKDIWKRRNEIGPRETLADLQKAVRDCEKKINNLTNVIASTGNQLLVSALQTLAFEKERKQDKIDAFKGTRSSITKKELLVLVRDNVANLLEVLNADVPLARQALQRHIKKLYLHPSETEDGPVFEVLGEIDFFDGPSDPEKSGVLLGGLGTQTPQQHTDRMYRFHFQIDPRFDLECPLLEPFCQLLQSQPELGDQPRRPKDWADLLRGVQPSNPNSGRPLRSGAVGWCLNNHRAILEQRLKVVEVPDPYNNSSLYRLALLADGDRPQATPSQVGIIH